MSSDSPSLQPVDLHAFAGRTRIDLPVGEIHVWHTRLDTWRSALDDLARPLTEEERARGNRFMQPGDRDRFMICRGLLRHLLSRYGLGPADQIPFAYEPRGKPELSKSIDAAGLQFNLAHSRDALVLAVTRDRSIGVDVERLRDVEHADAIARRNFAPEELGVYFAVDNTRRMEAFFRVWTRKEAFIKATGEGLYRALDSFAVTLDPDSPSFLRIDRDENDWTRWCLHDLTLDPDYPTALATDCAGRIVNRWLTPDC